MRRKYLDTTVFEARNLMQDGNIDYQFWHDKTIEEKLQAAAQMIEIAFREPNFTAKKIDRTIFSARKQHKV
jgi:predicted RNA polymerase sigma factor